MKLPALDYAAADAGGAPPAPAEDPAWAEARAYTAAKNHAVLAVLAEAGWPAPALPPYELTNAAGATIAEAEFAWPQGKVCFLTEGQRDEETHFKTGGWRVAALEAVRDAPEDYLDWLEQGRDA